jgi:PAS domain S-box-containing protein
MTVTDDLNNLDQTIVPQKSPRASIDRPDEESALSTRNLLEYMEKLELILDDRANSLEAVQKELEVQLTERSLVEAQLRAERDKMRHYLDIAVVGIMVLDCDGNISLINKKGCRILGYERDELLGKNWFDTCLPSLHRLKEKKYFARLMAGDAGPPEKNFPEKTVLTKAGQERLTSWHNQTLKNDKGQNIALLVSVEDITRARELERLIKIKNRMSTLGRVAAGISHEIRNPLAGINMYLTALSDILNTLETSDQDNLDTARMIVSKIQAASDKMESIIKRVLDFARPSAPNLQPLEINKTVERVLDLINPTLAKYAITVEKSLTPDIPLCQADPHMIEQVLINLATNSIEAMKTGEVKKLGFSSLVKDTGVILKISDSGPGVPEGKRKKIFDPFYSTKKAGSGIGLSLCRRIITDHGGRLEVGSSRWGGAEFRVEIPFENTGV